MGFTFIYINFIIKCEWDELVECETYLLPFMIKKSENRQLMRDKRK